jgi:hypothetical protein
MALYLFKKFCVGLVKAYHSAHLFLHLQEGMDVGGMPVRNQDIFQAGPKFIQCAFYVVVRISHIDDGSFLTVNEEVYIGSLR